MTDQDVQEILDKLNKVNGVLETVGKTATTSAAAERVARERNTAQLIKSMRDELGYTKEKIKQTIKQIELEEKEIEGKQESIKQEKRRQELQEKIDTERANAVKKLVSDLKSFATGSISASQSIYSSDQAFAAVKPTLDVLGSAVKAVSSAFTGLFAGIPILGSFFSSADKLIGPAVDLSVQVMQAQIDNAQKFVDTYSGLSKVGLTFGGAVEQMRVNASAAGMSLDSYSKFLTSNIENLSLMGGTLEQGASRVAKFGKTIATENPKLLAMYGSLEALQGGTADYAALLARSGIDLNRSDKDLIVGAKEYLVNMKELSALTGKSAETLKKSEEDRLKSAAYALRVASMEGDQRANTQNAMEQVQTKYGDIASKYAQEFIATNGKVTSESALLFKSQWPVLAGTIDRTIAVTEQTADEFKRSQAEITELNKDGILKEAKAKASLYELGAGGAAGDPYIEAMGKTGSAILRSQTIQGEAVEANTKLENERNATITKGTEAFVDTILGLNRFKTEIDEQTEKSLGKIGNVVTGLLQVQENINEMFGKNITAAVDQAVTALKKLAAALNREAPATTPGTTSGMDMGGAEIGTAGAGELTAKEQKKYGVPATGAAPKAPSGSPRIKSPESVAGGPTGEKIQAVVDLIGGKYGDVTVTAFDDAWHRKNRPNSKHTQGMAADLRIPNLDADMVAEINRLIAGKGKADMHPNAEGAGSHLHVEAMAKGGITNGPSIAGEAGPEAVIPLPDGRSIPVKMDMSEMVAKLEEMISLMRDQRDNSEKMLYAVQ